MVIVPTAEDFRALARSSPWRCTSAHFTRRMRSDGVETAVVAWLERPGRMTTRDERGERSWVEGDEFPRSPSATIAWAHHLVPDLRPDGLLAERPAGTRPWSEFEVDDPMYDNYLWVAMLDPLELAEGVELTEVVLASHHGRPVWSARAVPGPGYEPRCGCCPLLANQRTDQDEHGDDHGLSEVAYPEAYRVLLDHATGFVVSVVPLWATEDEKHRDLGFDVEIHASA